MYAVKAVRHGCQISDRTERSRFIDLQSTETGAKL